MTVTGPVGLVTTTEDDFVVVEVNTDVLCVVTGDVVCCPFVPVPVLIDTNVLLVVPVVVTTVVLTEVLADWLLLLLPLLWLDELWLDELFEELTLEVGLTGPVVVRVDVEVKTEVELVTIGLVID